MAEPATATPTNADGTISIQTAAQVALCSDQTILNLVKKGFIPAPVTRGRYTLLGVVHGRIRDLEDQMKGGTRSAAEDQVRKARAQEINLRNAQTDHKLIETEEAITTVDDIVGMIRTELDGLPARLTRHREERVKLESAIDDIFRRVRARFLQSASALRSSGELADEEGEEDA